MFHKHGIKGKEYEPDKHAQFYSRATQTWYTAAELRAGGHWAYTTSENALDATSTALNGLRLQQDANDSDGDNDEDEDEDEDEEEAMATAKKRKAPTKGADAPATKARKGGRGKAVNSSPEVARQLVPKSPRKSHASIRYDSDDSDADEDEGTFSAIEKIAKSAIVRGAAYGVTGNAYLVVRAGELLQRKLDHDPDASKEAKDDWTKVVSEVDELSKAYEQWMATVEERKDSGIEYGQCGGEVEGERHWTCPESSERIS